MHSIAHAVVRVVLGSSLLVLSFFLVVNAFYLLVHVLALFELRDRVREARWDPPIQSCSSPFYPGIAVVVPAYNESATIVENVRSLLALNYPETEIVVVNDGSTDDTLERLASTFELEAVDADLPFEVPSEEIRDVYRSRTHEELVVLDKDNGGKGDALNAGIWTTEMPLFCAVDADTIIDRDALLQLVRPFVDGPSTTVASGGVVSVANDCSIADGVVQSVELPSSLLPGLQVVEYLRAFYSGRLGLSRLNGLILISGAFGLFRTDEVQAIGGYRRDTVTEDFDLVVRLHRHLREAGREYSIEFVPKPVAWTEVPESRRSLGRQRRRWYRGLVETVVTNKAIVFGREYGRLGLVVVPMFVAAELFGPIVEGAGYVLVPLAWYFGVLGPEYFVAFFLLTSGFGTFISWFGVFSEVSSFNRYDSPRQVLRLLWYGLLENFGYRQWKVLVAWWGLFEYFLGVDAWGSMERTGLGD